MSVTIKFRRGNSAEWTSNGNVILASGEPGYELDTGRLKIGNGTTTWNNLQYAAIVPTGFLAGSGVSLNLAANGAYLTINSSGGATISNYGDNRVLTSDGTSTGINGESNLTFDGSLLNISGNLIANTGNFDQLVFNTSLIDPDLLTGQLQWNSTEGTLDLGLTDNYTMHLGEEMLYRVRNITGSTLRAGQPVYASGLSPGGNNRIEVNLYAANGTIREIRFMGLITSDLTDNGNNGYATHFGYIRGVDTNGGVAADYNNKLWVSGEPDWNEGDILYVHPTVPGKLTKVEPKHNISVAIVTSKGNNGKLFVRPTTYGHLDDNHDVNLAGASNGQFLQYNSSTDYWVPSSSGNFTTLTINNNQIPVGTGLANHVAYWNSSSGLVFDSGQLYWDPTNNRLGIGTQSPRGTLDVTGGLKTGGYSDIIPGSGSELVISNNNSVLGSPNQNTAGILFQHNGFNTVYIRSNPTNFRIGNNGGDAITIAHNTRNVGIGTASPTTQLHVIGTGNFSQNLLVNGTGVSLSGHVHSTSDITNFNIGVSGLVDGIYAPLISPALTGTPIAPTAPSGTNTTQIATTAFVRTAISNLVDSAPGTLDTLNELAAALGDDPNFATTVTNSIATKVAGTGTGGYVAKFTGSTGSQSIANSLIFDNGTRVSIGSTSNNLTADFSVSKTSGSVVAIGTNGSAGSFSVPHYMDLLFQGYNHSEKARIRAQDVQVNSSKSALFFSVKNNAGILTDIMTLIDDNVGIGISAPSSKLDVGGSSRISGVLSLYDSSQAVWKNITADGNNLTFDGVHGIFGFSIGLRGSRGSACGMESNATNGYLALAAGGSEKVRIATDGKVGIGTASPSHSLHVSGSGLVTNGFYTNHININNSVLTPANGALVVNGVITTQGSSVRGSDFSIYGDNNTRFYKPNGSTLAGSVSSSGYKHSFGYNSLGTHYDWVTINNTGLGIGTTTPQYKLDVVGTGNFSQNLLVNGTGVSLNGHTHTTSDITNFNSSVSGLLPTVANSGDNRILTSTGSTVGINGESNLTFNGTFLNVTGSGAFSNNLRLDSQTANTIVGFDGNKNITSLSTVTYPSLTELSYVKDVTSAIQTQLNTKQNILTNPVTGIGVSGHIAYWNSTSGIVADSGQLYWDSTNNRLGIGTITPSYSLEVAGTGNINTLRINKFDYTNLSISTGLADNDLLVTISDPSGLANTQTIQGNILRNSLLNQPARLQFRQGSNNDRLLITPSSGEPVWTTDTQKFYIGDGTTVGGDFIGPSPLEYSLPHSNSFTSVFGNNEILNKDRNAIGCSVIHGTGNLIAAYAIPLSGNIDGVTSTLGCYYDNNGRWNINNIPSGVRIDYTFNNTRQSTFATITGTTNPAEQLVLTVDPPVGVSGQTWTNVRVVNVTQSGTVLENNHILGGDHNTVCSFLGSTIIGGAYNFITNRWYNFIGNGQNNKILRGGLTGPINSSIVNGNNNILSGSNSVICGGVSNILGTPGLNTTLNNINSFIGGGTSNSIKVGQHNTIVGGQNNIVNTSFSSIPGGLDAKTNRPGEFAHAAGDFANPGDAQHSILIARQLTTNNTANQILFLDGANSRLILPSKTTWTFDIKLSAYNDTDDTAAGWIFRGAIKRNGSNTTSLVGSIIEENWKDTAMNNTIANVVADDTNEALEIRVTGLSGKNIRWVAVVDISQVSYGVV